MRSPCTNRPALRAVLLAACVALGGCAVGGGYGPAAVERLPGAALDRWAEGQAALGAARPERAEAAFAGLAADYPRLTGPQRALARLEAARGDVDGAATRLRAASELCQRCAPLLTELGVLERQRGDFDASRAAYEAALDLEPDFAPAHYDLAVLTELYLDEPATAAAHYERYLALVAEDPDAPRIRAWIARLEREIGAGAASTAQLGATP